jgi:hypothetical protein
MKNKILFSLFGGVIIFAWMFLSWAMPNLHKSASAYTPLQGEILQKFNDLQLKEGMYMLGQADPAATRDEQIKQYKELDGKSWAVVNYHKTMSSDMVMPMIRGFLVSIVISFLLFWLFLQQKEPTLMNRMYLSLAVGLIGFFFLPYSNFIWYKSPDIFAYFADGIVPWIILGFLGHKMAKPAA